MSAADERAAASLRRLVLDVLLPAYNLFDADASAALSAAAAFNKLAAARSTDDGTDDNATLVKLEEILCGQHANMRLSCEAKISIDADLLGTDALGLTVRYYPRADENKSKSSSHLFTRELAVNASSGHIGHDGRSHVELPIYRMRPNTHYIAEVRRGDGAWWRCRRKKNARLFFPTTTSCHRRATHIRIVSL